ncbi:MAG: tetratricopeptide repeat protein [Acidobacteriia bacterium]|jgi:Flp pilus assembly protein TadD|nr:tetratricopeptide repeat protein [Terriglobia bacterium]
MKRRLSVLQWMLAGVLAAHVLAPLFAQQSAQRPATPKPPARQALLAEAEAALAREDYAGAVQALRRFLAEEPDDAHAQFQLGYALTALGEREPARAAYERAVALKDDFAEAHLHLGLLLLDADPAAAVPHLARASALLTDAAQPRYLWGLALERSGQMEPAVARYREAIRLDDKNFDAHFALARVLLRTNQPAAAEVAFRAALERKPDAAAARLGLAESLITQGKLEAAVPELEAYLAAQPEDYDSRLQLAAVYLDLERWEAALAELDRVRAAGPSTARLHRLRAAAQIGLRQHAEAAASLERAAALEPDNARTYAQLGRVYLELRNFPAAERALRRALELDSQDTTALGDLAATLFLAGHYEAALAALDQLGERRRLAPGTWFLRAVCYDKLGRKPEALRAYEEFLARDDGSNPRETFQARQRARTLKRELERKR